MTTPWIEKVIALTGKTLAERYLPALPPGYDEENTPEDADHDFKTLETLNEDKSLYIKLYISTVDQDCPLHCRLIQRKAPIILSEVLPLLENFGFRVQTEQPYKFNTQPAPFYISDFALTHAHASLDINNIKHLFEEAFHALYDGQIENDAYNQLILGAELSWQDVIVLRAYTKYLKQTPFRLSQPVIIKALTQHPDIASDLVELFHALHHPSEHDEYLAKTIQDKIIKSLDTVTNLDDDRALRRVMSLIEATLRTNAFQTTKTGEPTGILAFKLESKRIPDLPQPVPLYETFVYSPYFEAIHLRNTAVARGGIRWSDRFEDFRTEVLGLMKAQKVKNAVIVPSGAKGGFVVKHLPLHGTREAVQAEVIRCYQGFIGSLLDLTDNIVDNKIVRPQNVVCHDDVDTYLVVAADKGTASFSDIANQLSKDRQFWLGDAFASGGSAGYDHKKMGITARGAFESVKRHFKELGHPIETTYFTVVGIGDMSGDVFGNGMLYTDKIKLIAAFDHRHIFIDPTPDPKQTYNERKRLFDLPTSSWDDFDKSLISPGGGVFSRNLKSIKLTPEMQKALDTYADALTPNELIRVILQAPVDLLFNGGIGTYVKASTESHADVGDRTNEYCRIDGHELRCKVVGEGGNLGFTQLGRIEYALKGGLINTDFIDNSAGVDCSDHEVNLKILLDQDVATGKLNETDRNTFLASLTQEVAKLVLKDNEEQALVMSFSAESSARNISLHQHYLKDLETNGAIDRKVEFLPDDKAIVERKAAGLGLTRPELAVLLAYTKIQVKHQILASPLIDDKNLAQLVETAFPQTARQKYHELMKGHRLYHELLATQLSNKVVNEMGITFIYRMQMETGASIEDIIHSYILSTAIFNANTLRHLIENLGPDVSLSTQYEMLFHIRTLISLASRWFLHSHHLKHDLQKTIEHFSTRITQLKDWIPKLMGGETKNYLNNLIESFQQKGLSAEDATTIATNRAIYITLNIIEVATRYQLDLEQTTQIYFLAGEKMNLLWFRDQISKDTREGHWNALARLSLRDEMDIVQRALTIAITRAKKHENDPNALVQAWLDQNQQALQRWDQLLAMLHASPDVDYTMFFIAIRELLRLVMGSVHEQLVLT